MLAFALNCFTTAEASYGFGASGFGADNASRYQETLWNDAGRGGQVRADVMNAMPGISHEPRQPFQPQSGADILRASKMNQMDNSPEFLARLGQLKINDPVEHELVMRVREGQKQDAHHAAVHKHYQDEERQNILAANNYGRSLDQVTENNAVLKLNHHMAMKEIERRDKLAAKTKAKAASTWGSAKAASMWGSKAKAASKTPEAAQKTVGNVMWTSESDRKKESPKMVASKCDFRGRL